MGSFIAVDPGLRGCGCAIFAGTGLSGAYELHRAGYVEGRYDTQRGPEVWRWMASHVMSWAHAFESIPAGGVVQTLVAEVPEVYAGMPKTDSNDLIDLAGVVGAIAGAFQVPTHFYLPRQWKGQLPKSTGVLRALAHLTEKERSRVELARKKSLDHNTADAVGIGLFHIGRFRTVQVFR